jgi:putative acetyltransferase
LVRTRAGSDRDEETSVSIRLARTPDDISVATTLMKEYRNWLAAHREITAFPDRVLRRGLIDLDAEIEALPGAYRPPGGALLLARVGRTPIGCAALRRLRRSVGEIKRIYVRPQYRGHGVGRRLTRAALDRARRCGYRRAVLDTLPTMSAAIEIYRREGFAPIPPYWNHPVSGALFFEYRFPGPKKPPAR